jgi:hypothetical protein
MRFTATTTNHVRDTSTGRLMGDGKLNTYVARDYVEAQRVADHLNSLFN